MYWTFTTRNNFLNKTAALACVTSKKQQVYELDKPMEVFRFLNPSLYAAYKQARKVGKMGSRKQGPAADSQSGAA